MRLALNSSVYVKYPIEDTIKFVSKIGYDGIEIARTHPFHELSKRDREKLRHMIEAVGLKVCAVQGATPYLDLEFAKKRIDAAADVGCPVVNLGCGNLVMEDDKREEYWAEVLENLGQLARYADDRGITVAVESEPPVMVPGTQGHSYYERLIGRTEDVQRVLSEVKAENLGVLLDIGHLYVMEENPLYAIEKLKDKIVHVHIEGIVDRVHCHFVPGRGEVDCEAVLKALHEIEYKGFISVELGPHMRDPNRAALESIQYLKGLLYKLELV